METIESLNRFAADLALAQASITDSSPDSQDTFYRVMGAIENFQWFIRMAAYFESERARGAFLPRHRF
jgi:hypothetical protein